MLNPVSVFLVLCGSLIGAVGALIIKKGVTKHTFIELWKSSFLWCGLFLYGLATMAYVLALRQEELSVLYPFVSTVYIWTTLFSVKYLGEKMNKWKWISLVGIIIGIIFIGLGS